MPTTNIPFVLNRRPGILTVRYETNQCAVQAGFDLFAGTGFDVNMCIGYPMMRARISSYEGTGYYTGCAWIQVITRHEYMRRDDLEPAAIEVNADVHEMLAASGVPFFALGFPAEIFDAPCNNLGELGKLDWQADTFLVTLPTRINDYTISSIAGFRWGYSEYDFEGKRQVEIKPLQIVGTKPWNKYLPWLCNEFSQWKFEDNPATHDEGGDG